MHRPELSCAPSPFNTDPYYISNVDVHYNPNNDYHSNPPIPEPVDVESVLATLNSLVALTQDKTSVYNPNVNNTSTNVNSIPTIDLSSLSALLAVANSGSPR
jgi:hypothetical protein